MQLGQGLLRPPVLQSLRTCMRRYASGAIQEEIERTLVVDTLATAKKLEALGMTRDQAEAMTQLLTEQIIIDRNRLSEKFVPRTEMEKVIIESDARLASFRSEVLQKQDMHLATLHKDLERQQNFLDKTRAEVRHEIDKLSASQRLDLNLEKGRMRDDLQHIRDKSMELEIKIDRESNDLRASVEKAKNDVYKSIFAIMGTFSAITFTISRFMQMT